MSSKEIICSGQFLIPNSCFVCSYHFSCNDYFCKYIQLIFPVCNSIEPRIVGSFKISLIFFLVVDKDFEREGSDIFCTDFVFYSQFQFCLCETLFLWKLFVQIYLADVFTILLSSQGSCDRLTSLILMCRSGIMYLIQELFFD